MRPGCTAAANAPGSSAVDDGDVDAEPTTRPLQEREGAGVELALGDDVTAGAAQREDRRGDRAHPAAVGQRVLGALQAGDGLLERAHRRVGVAAVELRRID